MLPISSRGKTITNRGTFWMTYYKVRGIYRNTCSQPTWQIKQKPSWLMLLLLKQCRLNLSLGYRKHNEDPAHCLRLCQLKLTRLPGLQSVLLFNPENSNYFWFSRHSKSWQSLQVEQEQQFSDAFPERWISFKIQRLCKYQSNFSQNNYDDKSRENKESIEVFPPDKFF